MKKGDIIYIRYSKTIRNNIIRYNGLYEIISIRGKTYHLYNNDRGVDLVFSKEEINKYIKFLPPCE